MKAPSHRIGEPPREVPLTLKTQMCLGGIGAQIGWALFAFGSIFFWVFAWHADLSGWRFRAGAVSRAYGEVLNCRPAGYSTGGSDDSSGDPIYVNEYHYHVGGASIGGASYSTGECAAEYVNVEYLTAHPEISRIEGTRRDVFGPWVLLVAILPGVGLLMAVLGARNGIRRVKLLRDGVPVAGRVTGKIATRSETMGRKDYFVTVGFKARDGWEHSVIIRTNRPEELENAEGAMVLYHPADPKRAVPVADLPGKLSEGSSGHLRGGSVLKYLLLPLVSAIVNGLFIWRNL
jgi:hypothetical protein